MSEYYGHILDSLAEPFLRVSKDILSEIHTNLQKEITMGTQEFSTAKIANYFSEDLENHRQMLLPYPEVVMSEQMAIKSKLIKYDKKLKIVKKKIEESSINVLTQAQTRREELTPPKKNFSWLTEKERQKWKDNWEKKQGEAAEFTKRMKSLQKEIKKRHEEKQRDFMQKMDQELITKLQKSRAQQAEFEKIKESQAMRRWEEFEKKREERFKLLSLANEGPVKKPRLYQRMQNQYIHEIEIPELEKRKLHQLYC